MPADYVLLGKITLTADASSVTFSTLPTTGYVDLKIVYSTRVSAGANPAHTDYIKFNNSSANFSHRNLQGAGSGTPTTNTDTIGIVSLNNGPAATASTFSSAELYISNYRSSAYKSFTVDSITENNATTAYIQPLAGLWSNTAAITEINIDPDSGNFVTGTTFSLYGLTASGATTTPPFATGGDIITNNGTYWIHTFLSSGTFTPDKTLSCDLLVVAGGAGGGGSDSSGRTAGGGGGAGGYLEQTGRSVTTGSYNVVIGAGGAQGNSVAAATPSGVTRGFNGSNSIFAAVTAIGGGAGQGGGGTGAINGSPNTGGSGGGGAAGTVLFFDGAAATQGNSDGATGFGFAGGNGVVGGTGGYQAGAGGGGAGGLGGNSLSSSTSGGGNGGVGGAGKQSSITGTATYYAAGGSGANEGSNASNTSTNSIGGAGGRGATSTNPTAGVANTGSGGGGSSYQGTGGTGGSGVVIIRYLMA
jgi:hypothetical protein